MARELTATNLTSAASGFTPRQIEILLRTSPHAAPEAAATLFNLPLDTASRMIDALRSAGLLPEPQARFHVAWSIAATDEPLARTLAIQRLVTGIDTAARLNRADGPILVDSVVFWGGLADPDEACPKNTVLEAALVARYADPAIMRRRLRAATRILEADPCAAVPQDHGLAAFARRAALLLGATESDPISSTSRLAGAPAPFRFAYHAAEVYGVDWTRGGLIMASSDRHPWREDS